MGEPQEAGGLAIVDLAIALGAVAFGYLMLVTADSPDHGSMGSLLVASMFVLTVVRRRMDGAPGASDGPAGGERGRWRFQAGEPRFGSGVQGGATASAPA